MCGISGIVWSGASRSCHESSALPNMIRTLAHRGPDDCGSYRSEDGAVEFGHTRLSIIDLSSAGHQPMASSGGRYWVTFNGEIYNYRELREQLHQSGVQFRTESDTEVLLAMYEVHGDDCLRRLRGMFAFAIWDTVERSCLIARDMFGIKPLYYHADRDRVVFASELKALLNSGLVPKRLNPTAVAGFFRTGSVPEPESMLLEVRSLPAGHALRISVDGSKEWQHSPIVFSPGPSDPSACLSDTRAALIDSVEHHFVSDVPVGIFLSGGVDSTVLLGLASRERRGEICTLSVAFDDAGFDESSLARRTAAHFGSTHIERRINASTARLLLDEFFSRLDSPTIDGFNTFVVSRFAQEQGIKVVLSGIGGDELFGGYPSFGGIPKMLGLRDRLSGPLAHWSGGVLECLAQNARWRRMGQFMRCEPSVRSAYDAYRSIFIASESARMALGYTGSLPAPCWSFESGFPSQPTVADEISALELGLYMRNQLLRDSDVMSMACGLELRVPFLDQELFAELSRVSAGVRLRTGKQFLLEAVPEVPEWIRKQPKKGFVFPFSRWFGAEWQPLFDGTSSRFGVDARTWYQKWAVFVFERWCRDVGVA